MDRTKRRNPIVAFLLSLIFPGLGHIYNGHLLKGILFLCGFWLLLILPGLSGLISSLTGLICFIAALIAYLILIATHAAIEASRLQAPHLKWYNRWYVYVCLWLVVGLSWQPVFFFARDNHLVGIKPFKVPSAAMEHALKVGDHFMAKWERYGNRMPARGDIVIFPYPEDKSKDFVKRIVGLPGEKIQIKNKVVYINDRRLDDPWGVHLSWTTLPGDSSPRDFFGPVTVPEGAVFVLGDNRDYSHDSRFWGPVETKEIQGKALFIYWSNDRNRIGKQLR